MKILTYLKNFFKRLLAPKPPKIVFHKDKNIIEYIYENGDVMWVVPKDGKRKIVRFKSI